MFRRNFYWVFLTTLTNVSVSFNQIQNMTEIARINQVTKGYSLGGLIAFCRYFKPQANSYEEVWFAETSTRMFLTTQSNVSVSFKQIQNVTEIAKIN